MSQTMLLTGGAGFIGSHIAVELLQDGYDGFPSCRTAART